jgi:nanoRNase/pAp phosphatase (c-di-AMP/oligoRNAs hydrolase)
MINMHRLAEIGNVIAQSRSVAVLLRSNPSVDQLLAAMALADTLMSSGKSVEIACADFNKKAFSDVLDSLSSVQDIDFEAIKDTLGNRNLTISFPYQEEAVENVSYHISDDGEKFYLTVKPQPGATPLQADAVSFDYSGFDADLILTVGVHDWQQLDYLYTSHEQSFKNATIVSVHSFETELTTFNLDTSHFGSMCEGVVWLLEGLQLKASPKAATVLLKGIELATDSFKSLSTTADTFESVAKLMRSGAGRVAVSNSQTSQASQKNQANQTNQMNQANQTGQLSSAGPTVVQSSQSLEDKLKSKKKLQLPEKQGKLSRS